MPKQFNSQRNTRGIEWCDETRNPIGGCMHACAWRMPDGTIAECYAKTIAESGQASQAYAHGFAHHYSRPAQLKALARGNEPLLIFVDSMADLFAANVPTPEIHAVLAKMRDGLHHSYQSLTKAAPRLLQFTEQMPPNLWVGVSSPPDFFKGHELNRGQQNAMIKNSLGVLWEVKKRTGNITWMSAEPLSWDITADVLDEDHGLDWIVIGAASSGWRYFQPDPLHVVRLLRLMDETHTPVFFKGNLRPTIEALHRGIGGMTFAPALTRWREDFPSYYHDGSVIPAVARRKRECAKHHWPVSRNYPLPVLG